MFAPPFSKDSSESALEASGNVKLREWLLTALADTRQLAAMWLCPVKVPRAGGVAGVADGGPGAGVGGDTDPGPGPLHRAARRPDREDDEPHRQPGVRHQGEPAPGTIHHNLIALLERSKST